MTEQELKAIEERWGRQQQVFEKLPSRLQRVKEMHNDISALLAEVRRLQAEIQKMRNCENCKKSCMKKPANTELDVLERMDYCKSHGRSAWKAR